MQYLNSVHLRKKKSFRNKEGEDNSCKMITVCVCVRVCMSAYLCVSLPSQETSNKRLKEMVRKEVTIVKILMSLCNKTAGSYR